MSAHSAAAGVCSGISAPDSAGAAGWSAAGAADSSAAGAVDLSAAGAAGSSEAGAAVSSAAGAEDCSAGGVAAGSEVVDAGLLHAEMTAVISTTLINVKNFFISGLRSGQNPREISEITVLQSYLH
jgi:hypothetical protein